MKELYDDVRVFPGSVRNVFDGYGNSLASNFPTVVNRSVPVRILLLCVDRISGEGPPWGGRRRRRIVDFLR